MKLADRLNCPSCNGRLATISANAMRCTDCERTIPVIDGVADFVGDAAALDIGAARYGSGPHRRGTADLLGRMQGAANDRWPAFLGDVIAFGSDETIDAIVAGWMIRSLLLLGTEMDSLQASRTRIASFGLNLDRPVGYATLSGAQDIVRDTVADTVVGTGLLSRISDVRTFLTMVHRVLKPGGRAAFVVPNRRFYKAMCSAIADALVQRLARDGAWPDGQTAVLELLAQTRRLLIHQGDLGFLSGLEEKHLFDSDGLQDLGLEVGFATAEMIPLDPDPLGAETTYRICREAGAEDGFVTSFAPLVAAVGQPYFSLLGRRDASASMLFWLTKASGPGVRIFAHRPTPPGLGFAGPDAALGGVAPRWSIELLARDTPDGIAVSVGGWCLCNSDVLWVRLLLDGVVRCAPVWRPRPDVHEVLNRSGLYHRLNTLCSGLANDLLFDGVHPTDNACPFRMEIQLTSGVIVSGPSPEMLVMHEPMVIAH